MSSIYDIVRKTTVRNCFLTQDVVHAMLNPILEQLAIRQVNITPGKYGDNISLKER